MITRAESEVSNDVENLQVQYKKVCCVNNIYFFFQSLITSFW